MVTRLWLKLVLFVCSTLLTATAYATFPSVPDELYKALNIDRSASPKELHEAVTKRYLDPAQGAGKGSHAQYWEPIPMSMYLDPHSFYKAPTSPDEIASRKECVECHADETPVWVSTWKKSTHANLDKVRKLSSKDPKYYKKAKLEAVEKNLRSMGKLGANEKLKEVSCIDCHVDINTKKKADHKADIIMPTAEVCGTCHLQEFAERESERDTLDWPEGIGWPDGRPSHALDYKANVEVSVYAGMPQREIAEGCTMCHINQNTCDHCHTRHEFSVAESRKPETCATCHSGIDHNDWTSYSMSKHGKIYQMKGDSWNWDVQMKDAYTKGGQDAPTCQGCHMEYDGEFTHNVVRKVRWANYPVVPGIAENILSDWSEDRKDSWIKTCTNCHSERWARSYFEFMDKGTLHMLAKYQEANRVVKGLYDDKLLTGQTTNRPDPLPPMAAGYSQFFQLFYSKDNNPSSLELKVLEMGENDLPKGHKGLAHVNPGGWTYTDGWGPLNRAYVEIMDENSKLRHEMELQDRIAKLESDKSKKKRGWFSSLLDPDSTEDKISLGGLGGGMLLAGTIALAGWRRREKSEH